MRRAYIGVVGATAPLARRILLALGLEQRTDVRVMEIQPGSVAARAGVEAGDLLMALDGLPLAGIDTLQRLLDSSRIGRVVTLQVLRRGRLLTLTAKPDDSAIGSA